MQTFVRFWRVNELGTDWLDVRTVEFSVSHFLARHCDIADFEKLVMSDEMVYIWAPTQRIGKVSFGRPECPVAAVLTKYRRLLYSMPEFDLERFLDKVNLEELID